MSNVLSFTNARESAVAIDYVEMAYDKLTRSKAVLVRPGQKNLSAAIRDALVDNVPIAAEAPTGTGKTIAYLVGGLSAATQLENALTGERLPVVVATATVGLQNQVIGNDLPKLIEAGIIQDYEAVIAKGRHRYFCILASERALQGESAGVQYDLLNPELNSEVDGLNELRDMDEAYRNGTWKGDIDSYQTTRPIFWSKVQATSDTCIGRRCDYFQECPYFEDRKKLLNAKVIVANHDLVLADLLSQLADQEPVFPFPRYLLLVDEAHHLPGKAMESGASKADIFQTIQELEGMARVSKKLFGNGVLAKFMESKDFGLESFQTIELENALLHTMAVLKQIEVDPGNGNKRFPGGVIPDNLAKTCQVVFKSVDSLRDTLGKASNALKNSTIVNTDPKQKPFVAEALYESSIMMGVLTRLWKAIRSFTGEKPAVKWLFRNEMNAALCVSPLEGDEMLKDLMWENPRVRVAMVSATLQDLTGFNRFIEKSGLPKEARTYAMPSSFPYRHNYLYLEDMKYSPRQSERALFEAELIHKLPQVIDAKEGTLVICNSKKLLLTLLPVLRQHFPGQVKAQAEKSLKQLLSDHRNDIDAGNGSILIGLATVAEGLDLPGKYCTHVIITTIPFAVPTNPVEEERAERLGKAYFSQHALPDAFVKLVQMVGRLMRRETDRGSITIFDNRIYMERYGWPMLKALPDFSKRRSNRTKPVHSV